MPGSVRSVNVGSPRRQRVPKGKATGIAKQPVEVIAVADPGPKRVEDGAAVSGVAGDFVGDGKHHGGSAQAVYAMAREELDWWSGELGRELPDGMFGENLTTMGLDVDAAEMGDIWRVGSAVLRVSGPRVPCATFAARMGERGWVKRVAARGRLGTYLAVHEPGEIRPGDEIVVERSRTGVDVPSVLRAYLGDADAAHRVLRARVLHDAGQAELESMHRRAGRTAATGGEGG